VGWEELLGGTRTAPSLYLYLLIFLAVAALVVILWCVLIVAWSLVLGRVSQSVTTWDELDELDERDVGFHP
jgi:uncharacterized membrane protein